MSNPGILARRSLSSMKTKLHLHRLKRNEILYPHLPTISIASYDYVTTQQQQRTFASGGGSNSKGGKNNNNRRNDKSNNKSNFDRTVLQPAARGQLSQKHKSGIPKLAARKNKVHLEPQKSRPRVFVTDSDDPDFDKNNNDSDDEDYDTMELSSRSTGTGKFNSKYGRGSASSSSQNDSNKFTHGLDYYAPQLFNDKKYFWREEEYEEYILPDLEFNEDGEFVIDYDKSAFDSVDYNDYIEGDSFADVDTKDEKIVRNDASARFGEHKEPWEFLDPEEHFFYSQNDIFELATADVDEDDIDSDDEYDSDDDAEYNTVTPLSGGGAELDEFLEAMQDHPTKYARIDYQCDHPESQREPVPDIPPDRAIPPLEFVGSHARFLYVTGLPPLEMDGEDGDLSNPIHRNFLEKQIAHLADVDTTRVFAANLTSGYVGFASPQDLAIVLSNGPTDKVIPSNARLTKYTEEQSNELGNEFFKVLPEATLLLDNIPSGNTPISLARQLFPKNTEVGSVYGNLKAGNFFFLSKTKVMVRFESKEQADSALSSALVRDRLQAFGQYHVRFFRARRELVHDGFGGPTKSVEKRKMGSRLIVDGDMPSKTFFLSHAGVLKIRNLDPTLTKADLSKAFQPYSTYLRDIDGSIEFVTCEGGLSNGCAYVGFDVPGDCEEAIKSLKGRMPLGDRVALLKLVRIRKVPNRPVALPERRPDRPIDELLVDITGWEQYVDQADLELLDKAGISRTILNEALVAIRQNNATFGSLDSTVRSEALHPEKSAGQEYRDLVQLYIQTLKECLVTPTNVGDLYEAVHFPNEPIDLSIFESEKERQTNISKEKART